MGHNRPRVSIGLPVYNGANFISETVDSILGQTFGDFELIISDNGSNDGTEEICREYAAGDQRIRYERYDTNSGATWNFNNVVHLSRGEYFKWTADDDLCEERFLTECIDVLEQRPEVVLAYTYAPHIDVDGRPGSNESSATQLDSPDANLRFRNVICHVSDGRPFYGVIRSDILKKTRLLRSFDPGDIPFLAELVLHGPFFEIPLCLQYRRIHPMGSDRCFRGRRHERASWYDPRKTSNFDFPWWRLLGEYARIACTARLPVKQRALCLVELLRWLKWGNARLLKEDIQYALPSLGFRRKPKSVKVDG